MNGTTRRGLLAGGATIGATALASPALGQAPVRWRMATSWPENLPGPGVTARRITERVAALSDGRFVIDLYAAGELVPALEAFDAVEGGTVDMAHTAALFWGGKVPAAPIFTAAPFGLTPLEHVMWIEQGGGQALWDRAYAPFGIKPFMAGNTGVQMGGWFKRPIETLDDWRGLKIRMPGLGGEVAKRLGATPVTLAPGDILPALQAGTIDAAEFLGPASDAAMGFYRAASVYHYPGFHEPNGTGEALVSITALGALPADLRAILEQSLAAENAFALAEGEWRNAVMLKKLVDEDGVTLRAYPQDMLDAAREASREVMADLAARDALSQEIVESYSAARELLQPWSEISTGAVLAARGDVT